MNRKQFMQSLGASCSNWNWSWSFVNHEEKFVVFGYSEKDSDGNRLKIFSNGWEFGPDDKKKRAYSQSMNHIRLVKDEGYQLKVFKLEYETILNKKGYPVESIKSFEKVLHDKDLVKDGGDWFAIDCENKYQQIAEFIENMKEQNEIEHSLKNGSIHLEKSELLKRIQDCENDKSEVITINGKSFKRHNYLMTQIKRYRDFKCQFCSTSILKENGEFYIEACHIEAKANGGKDSLENILVLCPNCHKLFDFGKREDENYTSDFYSVVLNGKKYEATLK